MAVRPSAHAAMLCKRRSFALYLDSARRRKAALTEEQLPDGTHNAEDAADFIRAACGVRSRSEIDGNRNAQEMLTRITKDYSRWAAANRIPYGE